MKKVFLVTMITAMLVFTATLASATYVPLGKVVGSGSASCANVGCTNYFTGVFTFDDTKYDGVNSFKTTVFNDVGQYTMSASSYKNLEYSDYNGIPGTPAPLSKPKGSNAAWIIANGAGGTTFYGQNAYWDIATPSNGAGEIRAELVSDGNIHWYYGFDNTSYTFGGKTINGSTDLTSWNLADSLYFIGGYQFLSETAGSDNLFPYSITGTVYVKTVPEPATMLLFSLGLLGLAGVRRKLKK